jgi:hypothetical protein
VLGSDRTIKEFGVALGAAIVIDAFLRGSRSSRQ